MPAGAAAAATVGSAVVGGIAGMNAAGANSQLAQDTAKKNNAAAQDVYKTNTGNLQPFVDTGRTANSALEGLLGIGGDPTAAATAFANYKNSTNYNFVLDQGLNAVKTANAPSFNSSATAKALNNYAQGQAGSALAGYEGILGGLNTTGEGAAGTLGTLGTQYAGQIASNNNAAAGLEANSNIQGANALSGLASGVASGFTSPFVRNAFGGIGASSFSGPPGGVGGENFQGG